MKEVGIRQLKTHVSEIVNDVKEHQQSYAITYRGRIVGQLLPANNEAPIRLEKADPWEKLVKLGQTISQEWCVSKTSLEILDTIKR